MDILKCLNLTKDIYKVNIEGTHENPLYQANNIAEILELTNIHQSLMDFDSTEKVILLTKTNGGMQNVTFLTEQGLYRLLIRSNKDISKIFQKWICENIKKIRTEGEYKLNPENEIDKKMLESKIAYERHSTLLKSFDKQNVIYICKLRDENNKLLIKIGSTQNIKERISNIACSYNNIQPYVINLTRVTNYIKFENYLHNHDFFKNYFHPIANKQNKISRETYIVSDEIIRKMIKIIDNDKLKFENENILQIEMLKLEVESKKLELQMETTKNINKDESFNVLIRKINNIQQVVDTLKLKNNDTDNDTENISDKIYNIKETNENIKEQIENINKIIVEKNKVESSPIFSEENISLLSNDSINTTEDSELSDSDEDDIDITTIYFSTKKTKPGIKSPLVYQYDINDLTTPLKIYDSPSEVERAQELKHLEISPTPLRNAAKNNTIYKGFRWYFLKRDETIPETILNTVQLKHKETEIKFLAMIDITQTKIMAVYQNQKEATKARLMKCNSFHRAIQNGSISSGHYWKYFDDCSKEMQSEYLKNNVLPEKYVSKVSKKVEQICPKTKQILKTYDSNRDVIKLFKMSVTSLKKYSESGEIHNGYIWKIC